MDLINYVNRFYDIFGYVLFPFVFPNLLLLASIIIINSLFMNIRTFIYFNFFLNNQLIQYLLFHYKWNIGRCPLFKNYLFSFYYDNIRNKIFL